MSRIGKQPIELLDGVEVKIDSGVVKVKGSKGELSQDLPSGVLVEVADGQVVVSIEREDDRRLRAMWGLYRSLIDNMISGVTKGFEKKLEINGVGYKAEVKGKKLVLNLGYSHPIEYEFSDKVEASVEGNVITISGIDKQMVGQVAAEIRSFRKPEPYKGKGVKYIDEIIIRKVGKAVKSAE